MRESYGNMVKFLLGAKEALPMDEQVNALVGHLPESEKRSTLTKLFFIGPPQDKEEMDLLLSELHVSRQDYPSDQGPTSQADFFIRGLSLMAIHHKHEGWNGILLEYCTNQYVGKAARAFKSDEVIRDMDLSYREKAFDAAIELLCEKSGEHRNILLRFIRALSSGDVALEARVGQYYDALRKELDRPGLEGSELAWIKKRLLECRMGQNIGLIRAPEQAKPKL